jgi:hypothetical protein
MKEETVCINSRTIKGNSDGGIQMHTIWNSTHEVIFRRFAMADQTEVEMVSERLSAKPKIVLTLHLPHWLWSSVLPCPHEAADCCIPKIDAGFGYIREVYSLLDQTPEFKLRHWLFVWSRIHGELRRCNQRTAITRATTAKKLVVEMSYQKQSTWQASHINIPGADSKDKKAVTRNPKPENGEKDPISDTVPISASTFPITSVWTTRVIHQILLNGASKHILFAEISSSQASQPFSLS